MTISQAFRNSFNNIEVDYTIVFNNEGTQIKRFSHTTVVAVLPRTIALPKRFITALVVLPVNLGIPSRLMVIDQTSCTATVYRFYDTVRSVWLEYSENALENQACFSEEQMYDELFTNDWWEEQISVDLVNLVLKATPAS